MRWTRHNGDLVRTSSVQCISLCLQSTQVLRLAVDRDFGSLNLGLVVQFDTAWRGRGLDSDGHGECIRDVTKVSERAGEGEGDATRQCYPGPNIPFPRVCLELLVGLTMFDQTLLDPG
jgi:hypothetical protein